MCHCFEIWTWQQGFKRKTHKQQYNSSYFFQDKTVRDVEPRAMFSSLRRRFNVYAWRMYLCKRHIVKTQNHQKWQNMCFLRNLKCSLNCMVKSQKFWVKPEFWIESENMCFNICNQHWPLQLHSKKVYVRESAVSRVVQVGVAHLMHGVESDIAGLDRRHRGWAGAPWQLQGRPRRCRQLPLHWPSHYPGENQRANLNALAISYFSKEGGLYDNCVWLQADRMEAVASLALSLGLPTLVSAVSRILCAPKQQPKQPSPQSSPRRRSTSPGRRSTSPSPPPSPPVSPPSLKRPASPQQEMPPQVF